MMHVIPVNYGTTKVGHIEVSEAGPVFLYDASWMSRRNAFPISVRMPLDTERVEATVLIPWLMNLLPEGGALPTVGRNLGVSPQDVLGMVDRIGRDTAGALSIGKQRTLERASYIPIPDDALERIIEELPVKPFLAGQEGVSMSLAGAQEKLPVAFSNGRLAIPVNGAPSTHILKPDIERLPGSVQNEALCMVLAKRVGMTVAEVTTGRAGQRKYLLVTRYDRVWRDDRWLRVHQEDFCQALGRVPGAKYEHNGTGTRGPGLTNFFDLARRHLQPGDILRLRDAIILNVLLTNVDSHSKNYSLLLVGGRATMAPLYDLMCAESWPHVTKNMAQDIAGKTRGKYLCGRHWQRMATACGINGTALLKRVRELAERVEAEVDSAAIEVRAMPAGDHHIVDQTIIEIKARCSAIKRQLTMDENDLEDVDESNLEEETGDMETVVSDLLPS